MDLNHLHLMVRDLEKSMAFYAQFFGFKEKVRYGPSLLFMQNDSGFDLALTPTTSVESLPKGVHFGFSLPDRARLEEKFAKIKQQFPSCISAEAPSDHGDWGSFACLDPDGYTVEVYWDSNLHIPELSDQSRNDEGRPNSAQSLLEKYKVEINKHSFETVEPLISKDCKFWFSNGTFVGLEQARRSFEKTWGTIKNEVYSLSDVDWITDSAEAAVCTYTFHWKGLVDGKALEGKGRGTSCFRKEESGWKIIHEHLSHFPKS